MHNLVNQTVKGYEIRELVGAGGFGAVYRAVQTSIGREVAIKVILPAHANQPDYVRHFEIEAQLISRLEHPHIVPLYDYWREPNGAFLVMRWLRSNLRTALQKGAWSLEASARLLDHISGALTVAHREGVVHRDIKPDNILLDEDENGYLADFGIAKDTNVGHVTDEGMLVGSPAYTTPEQIRGEPLTTRTDIYSLGLVLYELLANESAFPEAKTPAELIAKHLNTPIPRLHLRRPNLPAAIDEVLGTATAKDSNQRYSTVARFAAAFRAALPNVQRATAQPLAEPLTERELDILHLMIEDLSNQQIAERLYLSAATIKWYVKQIYAKLDVHTRFQAVERARALKLFGSSKRPTAETLLTLATTAEVIAVQPIAIAQNPYKGLRAFRESDAADFFGRAALVEGLLTRLSESDEAGRFLVISGPSGSGKSSAVRAGLIPALRGGGLPDSERWFITEMIPGSHPFEELEAALLRVAVNPIPSVLEQLNEDRRGLVRAAKRVLPSDQDVELVIFIDQFEELFTLTEDDRTRRHFIDNLLSAATDPRGRVRLVLTLRADFYDKPLVYPRLAELVRRHTEFILPLNDLELERAIVGPAERVGVTMGTGVVAAVVREVGEQTGALPLMQYALTESFERRSDNSLTLDSYRATGGIVGALARRADTLYEELGEQGQQACQQLFLRLVTLGEGVEDTRRRVLQSELERLDGGGRIEEVINAFARYRLLTLDHDPVTRGATVEVAHEALIRTWDRLRGWLTDAREEVRIQRRLSSAAAEWMASERDSSFLADGARLTQFEALAAGEKVRLNVEERAYVQASADERDRRAHSERERQQRELSLAKQAVTSQKRAANRLRYLAAVLLVFLLVAGALSGIAINSANQLATNLKLSEAQRLALVSMQMQPSEDATNNLKALLAIRSVRAAYTPQGDQAIVEAAHLDFPVARLAIGNQFLYSGLALYSPNGNTLVTSFGTSASGEEELWLWDANTFQKLRRLEGYFRGIYGLTWTRDSQYLVAGVRGIGEEDILHVWEASTGRVLRRISLGSDALIDIAITPNGKEICLLVVDTNEQYVIRYLDLPAYSLIKRVTLPFNHVSNTSLWLSHPTTPDHKALAIVSIQGQTPMIWDLQKDEKLRELEGTVEQGIFALFSPSLRYLAMSIPAGNTAYSIDSDYIVQVWDTQTGKVQWTFSGFRGGGGPVNFSLDERFLATGTDLGDNKVQLWDLRTGKELHRWNLIGENSIGFSPDSQLMIITRMTIGVVEIYPISAPTLPHILPHPDRVRGVAISHDGKFIATAGGDGIVRLWDAHHLTIVRELVGHPDRVSAVNFSPDNQYLISSGRRDGYRVWDVQSGQQVWAFQVTGSFFYTAEFSPDGKFILAIDHDEALAHANLMIVEIGSGIIINRLPLPIGFPPNCARFSPDAKYIAVSFNDVFDRGLLWEWKSNKPPMELVNAEHSPSRCGQFTPNSKYLFLGGDDGVGRLYEAATGADLRIFRGHADEFMDVAVSLDGRYLLTANADFTARIWELETAKEIRRFTFSQPIWGVAFSPEGKFIVIGSYGDNAAIIYRTDLNEEMTALCARLSRDFTPQERITYGITDSEPTCSV